MIRGISKQQFIDDMLMDTNSYMVAREYGLCEVIDGFLYYNYEGTFTDEEVDAIIELFNTELNLY